MVKVINIDTKTRTIRVENAADGDIKTWRTTESGAHFPIKKGESTKEALDKFVEKKRPEAKKDESRTAIKEARQRFHEAARERDKVISEIHKLSKESGKEDIHLEAKKKRLEKTMVHESNLISKIERDQRKELEAKLAEKAQKRKERAEKRLEKAEPITKYGDIQSGGKQQPAKKPTSADDYLENKIDKLNGATITNIVSWDGSDYAYVELAHKPTVYIKKENLEALKKMRKETGGKIDSQVLKKYIQPAKKETKSSKFDSRTLDRKLVRGGLSDSEIDDLARMQDYYDISDETINAAIDAGEYSVKEIFKRLRNYDDDFATHLSDFREDYQKATKQPKQSSQPTSYDLDDAFDEADLGSEWGRAKHRMDFHGVSQYTIKDIIDSGKYEAGDIIEALESNSHDKIDEMRKSLKNK